ncbi:MAG: ATP-dependent Clp protease adaptor ClpS [Pseudomonadota bacterium]
MSEIVAPAKPKTTPKTERPPLWKVILLNDDFTPREFVIKVLMRVFHMGESEAEAIMITAHQKGSCVVAVFTFEIAEMRAQVATEAGARAGYPLTFTTEKET